MAPLVRYGGRVPEPGTIPPAARLPRVLGEAAVAAEPLRHGLGNAATGGIWRVRGTAGSAILKVARLPAAADPRHGLQHQRRARPLELLAPRGPGLRNRPRRHRLFCCRDLRPALLEANAREDGGIELWLADVAGTAGWDWPVPRLARFAYELGAAQARWAGRVPDLPWLSRHWLAQYLTEGPPRLARVADEDWDHPSVAVWPAEVRRRLRRLHSDHARQAAIAASAARTLCHLDVWPANLIDDDGTSVLLDWSFTGDGAVGEDISNLVIDSCTDGLMDVALLPEIAETATDGYLRGLRDGGWTGSADAVRTTIAACGAAKYSWFAAAVAGRAARDNIGRSSYGQDASAAAAASRVTALVTLRSRHIRHIDHTK